MNWWIFIHIYLWQNSLRRWWEQPLSLLSKLVVAGLLGLFGALVILGLKNLGEQLDRRLNDRDSLTAIISETVTKEAAAGMLDSEELRGTAWQSLSNGEVTFLQAAASAEMENGERAPVMAVVDLEQNRLVDDFYYFTENHTENLILEFQIKQFRSEARSSLPSAEIRLLLNDEDALIGSVGRLSGILVNGFTKTTVLHAKSLDHLRNAHDIVAALSNVEDKRIVIRSNLRILQELEKIRAIQAQSLIWVTLASSVILGLIFGSLAWMEFREERYLLSLIRSFGVGRMTLLAHALMENCLLAVSGVLLGFAGLQFAIFRLNLDSLQLGWLSSTASLYGSEGRLLLTGAAVGGILACVPVAIGLRKSLGLVLK